MLTQSFNSYNSMRTKYNSTSPNEDNTVKTLNKFLHFTLESWLFTYPLKTLHSFLYWSTLVSFLQLFFGVCLFLQAVILKPVLPAMEVGTLLHSNTVVMGIILSTVMQSLVGETQKSLLCLLLVVHYCSPELCLTSFFFSYCKIDVCSLLWFDCSDVFVGGYVLIEKGFVILRMFLLIVDWWASWRLLWPNNGKTGFCIIWVKFLSG